VADTLQLADDLLVPEVRFLELVLLIVLLEVAVVFVVLLCWRLFFLFLWRWASLLVEATGASSVSVISLTGFSGSTMVILWVDSVAGMSSVTAMGTLCTRRNLAQGQHHGNGRIDEDGGVRRWRFR
jgi:hypothetical protein